MATVAVKDVSSFLSSKQSEESDKDLAGECAQLEELHNRKLWQQLTLKLETLVKNQSLQKGNNLLQLCNNFIHVFENKINPLTLSG